MIVSWQVRSGKEDEEEEKEEEKKEPKLYKFQTALTWQVGKT